MVGMHGLGGDMLPAEVKLGCGNINHDIVAA